MLVKPLIKSTARSMNGFEYSLSMLRAASIDVINN